VDPRSDPRHQIRWLRGKADLVLERLPELPADHPAQHTRKEVVRLATELSERARLPITIGLVGEFSVGKSELFNALIGRPGLLYVSPAPATGNVTAIEVKALAPDERPGDPSVTVSFMSRREIADAARFMLGKLVQLVHSAELRYDVDALADGYNPVTDGFETLEKVARPWWQGDGQVALQLHTWELFRLRDALAVGDELLDEDKPSWPIPVDPDQLRAAIRIGNAREVPRTFPGLASGRPVRRGSALTAISLQQTFPLIRRVTFEVGIDPGLWDLGGMRESNGLVFLDFPGLNASGGTRDEFLCREELKTLTSFVEVLAAPHAEGEMAAIFATILEGRRRSTKYLGESVLLAANMFDQIRDIPEVPDAITLQELRGESELIDSLIRILGELSHEDWSRVAFTSAVPGVRDARWARVAAALQAGGQTHLAAAIRGYLADGGIERLRGLIATQVSTKALRIEADELMALRDVLLDELTRLHDLLRPLPVGAAGDEAQRRLADLVVALSSTATELRTGAALFRDPRAIMVNNADSLTGGQVDLLKRITQAATLTVYGSRSWADEWRKLFEAVQPELGSIPLRQQPADGEAERTARRPAERRSGPELYDDDDDDDQSEPDDPIPLSTEDFRTLFVASSAELRGTARKLANDVLTEWIAGYDRTVAPVRRELRDPEVQRLLASRLAVLDPRDGGARRLRRINRIVELDWVPRLFRRTLEQTEDAAAGANTFPLALNKALWWSALFKPAEEEDTGLDVRRHHSAVQRLRYDLAEGLAFPVQNAIATAFGHLAVELDNEFQKLIGRIPIQADLLAFDDAEVIGDQAEHGIAAVLSELIDELTGDGRMTSGTESHDD
jgi:hypothetical protein